MNDSNEPTTLLEKLSKPLLANQIDFRIQSINKGGYATILAYKDARVDISRLNEVCGPLGWKREHCRDNHNCIVSIYDCCHNQWVSKEDTGTESFTEKEKGLASDSFKRACFNWGIGIELYDFPLISVKLKDNEWENQNGKPKQTWNLKLREWKWFVQHCEGKPSYIAARDEANTARFEWGEFDKVSLSSAIRDHWEEINDIKEAIANERYEDAKTNFSDLPANVQKALWVAPSKGGVFTTDERKVIKEGKL